MPAIPAKILVDSIIDAVQQSGGSAVYIPSDEEVNPRRFIVQLADKSTILRAYIWTLTPGGRPTLPNEFRIQMTSVVRPLVPEPSGYTLLLGYYHDLKLFAGFDFKRHMDSRSYSPSVQIDLDVIHRALQNGLAFAAKSNQEIAVGVRPDFFLAYTLNADAIHAGSGDAAEISVLEQTMEGVAEQVDFEVPIPAARESVVNTVRRWSRDARFRHLVLAAYENRCAITRMQMRLVDAAHIVPVLAEKSSDKVQNGVALSPTMHRAFDNGIIYLDTSYVVRVNEDKIQELTNLSLSAGDDQLRKYVNTKIFLPHDPVQRPHPELILEANRYRRIPGF